MSDRISIVSVPVSDPDRARSFYVESMGFSVVRDNAMGPTQRWIQLAPPGGEATITLVTWFETMPAGSQRGLVMSVDDLDGRREELAQRGVDVTEVQSAPWGRYATLRDPDGNGWVLQAAPKGAS